MKRRDFIGIMSIGATVRPFAVRAERPNSAPLVGALLATRADDALSKGFTAAFDKAVHEQGSASSQDIKIEYRFGAGGTGLTQAFDRELIGMRPTVIVAVSNTSMAALHQTSTTIPVVFLAVSDPVGMGYVISLSRPGGSVTGLTPFEPSAWRSVGRWAQPEHMGMRDPVLRFRRF